MKKTLKFALPALLLSAGVLAYADGEVTLKDKTTMAWSAFVDALNNPPTVKGEVDKESTVYKSWDSAKTRLATANETLEEEQAAKATADTKLAEADVALNGREASEGVEAVVGAKQAVLNAEATQTAKATALTTAQKTYSDANDEYNKALGDQSEKRDSVSSREKMLAQAQANVAAKEAEIAKTYDDQIAAKQATINANTETNIPNAEKARDQYQRLMNALVKTTYNKVTAPWLVQAQADAINIRDNFNPKGTANSLELYYKADVQTITDWDDDFNEITSTTVTLMISLVPQGDGWYKNNVPAAFLDIPKKYTTIKASTIINKVQIYFGYTDGKPNYGNNSILTITPNAKYTQVADPIYTAIYNIDEKSYQVDGTEATQTISDPELYKEYETLYNDNKTLAETTLPNQNRTLANDISELTKTKTAALSADTTNESLKNLRKTASDIDDILKEFQQELADDTAIVNKYRATTYKDSEENEKNYIGADGKVVSYLNYLSYQQTVAQNEKTAADNAVTAAQKAETAAQNAYNTASTAASNAANDVKAAETEVKNAQSAFDSAQIAYDAAKKEADAEATAEAQKNYTEVTLNSDVTVSETINSFSGTFNGGDHIVTVPTGSSLFGAFNGTLSEVAINGKTFVSQGNNASFTNVARWDGTSGVFYGAGTKTDELEDLGQLGFAARGKFGVNFASKELVDKTDNTTVYNITEYNSATSQTQSYVTISPEKKFISANNTDGFTLAKNRFAKSATPVGGLGLTNVFYGENNECDQVEIADKVDFYCPVNVKADDVSFDRVLTGGTEEVGYGYNSICLPFDLSYSYAQNNDAIVSICTFEKVDNNRFWFTQIDKDGGVLEANTPGLVVVKYGNELKGMSIGATEIQKTEKYIFTDQGATDDPSVSYGTFKKVSAAELNGQSNLDYIFGLTTSGTFKRAATTGDNPASFLAFRMAISTKANAIQHAPGMNGATARELDEYGIGILDKDGNDITDEVLKANDDLITGIDEAAAASLSIKGGQGVITIASDANYGKVPVYSIDGRMVATANVEAGETATVNVQTGVYIVLGQKVLVK